MKDENVLVVPRRLFDELGAFQGIRFDAPRYLERFLQPGTPRFHPRAAVEEDADLKQLIPYLIVEHGGQVLHYVRGQKGGEARLATKGSIGIGGHINDQDADAHSFDRAAYERAVNRELHEELEIDTPYRHQPVALINDDSNAVGAVHLGIVHVVHLDAPKVGPGEAVIEELGFLPLEQIIERQDQLETWSSICANHLLEILTESERLFATA